MGNKKNKSNQKNVKDYSVTKFDEFEDQKFVDDIPLEDLKIEAEQEKKGHKTQNSSQSERKYK